MLLANIRIPLATYLPLFLLLLGCCNGALAAPDFSEKIQFEELTLYPDHIRKGLFYYMPGEIELVYDEDSGPDFRFLLMRFTGNVVRDNQGTIRHHSLLSFRLRMIAPALSQLALARKKLKKKHRTRVEIRPLPIEQMESSLVYAAVNDATSHELPEGRFEGDSDAKLGSYWSERAYTLSLGPEDAQLLWQNIENGQISMSFAYALYARGLPADRELTDISGSPQLLELVAQESTAPADNDEANKIQLISANALAISVDRKRWPKLAQEIDINDRVPPGYGLLEVYCYDFQNDRPSLFEKRVEIEAQGVGGKPIRRTLYFNRDQADVYAQRVRFPVAVLLNQAYRFRVHEAYLDGSEKQVTDWTIRNSWVSLLDVSSPDPFSTNSNVDEPDNVVENEGDFEI